MKLTKAQRARLDNYGWDVIDVEVDGKTHDTLADQRRDERLKSDFGVQVLRFRNRDVNRNLDGVLLLLVEELSAPNHPPTPSLSKEGEE